MEEYILRIFQLILNVCKNILSFFPVRIFLRNCCFFSDFHSEICEIIRAQLYIEKKLFGISVVFLEIIERSRNLQKFIDIHRIHIFIEPQIEV